MRGREPDKKDKVFRQYGPNKSREKEEKDRFFQQKNQYYSLFFRLFYQLDESSSNSTVFVEKRCKLRYD